MIQVLIRVLVLITFFGSFFIPFATETIAQNTVVAPIYIDRAIYKAAQEGLICSEETIEKLDPSEREERKKVCGLELELETEGEELQASTSEPDLQAPATESETPTFQSEPNATLVIDDDEEISLLPDSNVEFVEEYVVKYDGNKSKDTIFYGGVVPFVALPDSELATEDSFFNEESFSVFFYLKRKF